MNNSPTQAHAHAAHEPHACPFWILSTVFAVLLVLTALTVFTATQIDLGPYNLVLAMAIATLKALLVALFFMHLWWDNLFNGIAILAGVGFLALFITMSMMDTYQYEPTVKPLGEVLTPELIEQTAKQPAHADPAHEEPAHAEPAHE